MRRSLNVPGKKRKSRQTKPQPIRPILQFSVLCDSVAHGPDGKAVFLGVFESFKRPVVVPQFAICNRWINGQGRFKQKTRLLNPKLELLVETPYLEFELANRVTVANFQQMLTNVNFSQPGVYWVEVWLNEERVLSYPVPVYAQPTSL